MKKKKIKTQHLAPLENLLIQEKILSLRGQKILLAQDLAKLYGVSVKTLIQAMKRNINRFPKDFVFQLNKKELENLKSQFVTSSWGGIRRALPYAFTEHGVAMLSSVLNSPRAIEVNIFIIRTFIKLREVLFQDQEFGIRILDLELIQGEQGKDISEILEYIRRLIDEPIKPSEPIGFRP